MWNSSLAPEDEGANDWPMNTRVDADPADNAQVSGALDTSPLSAREAADRLGLNERTIRRAIARGDLPATHHAGVYRIDPVDVARYAEARGQSLPVAQPPAVVETAAPIEIVFRQVFRASSPIPQPLTALIGRERERSVIESLVLQDGVRLLTLTGPGGVGKTRLAIAVANDLAAAFADGSYFVPLATVTDVTSVASVLATALGLVSVSSSTATNALLASLREREMLIVLDNLEHLLGSVDLVTRLLEQCPGVRVLVTSRTLLRSIGEQVFPISPLALPSADETFSLETVFAFPSVELFTERARAVVTDFALTETTAPLIVDICRRLDGLPLAIELAAARLTHLSLASLRDRLQQRLPLLTGGGYRPDRHRTLRNAISWSEDLLSPAERALFRRLAVFRGRVSLDAIEHVLAVGDDGSGATPDPGSALLLLDQIGALVDASLLIFESNERGNPTYRMLETIHEFATEQLGESGEAPTLRQAHADYYVAFVHQHAPTPFFPEDGHNLTNLAENDANLMVALRWLATCDDGDAFAQYVAALGWYWMARGHLNEGIPWFEHVFARSHDLSDQTWARVALVYGVNLLLHGDAARGRTWARDAFARATTSGISETVVSSLIALGLTALGIGDPVRAIEHLTHALAQASLLPDRTMATALEAATYANLGVAARNQGDYRAAVSYHEEALARQRAVGYTRAAAQSLVDLADVADARGDLGTAHRYLRESLRLGWEYGDIRVIVESLDVMATVSLQAGLTEFAVRLLAVTEHARQLTGLARWAEIDRVRFDTALATARATLPDADFENAWAFGRSRSLEQATVDALAVEIDPPIKQDTPLSSREMDVLRHLAVGKTDRDIAEALFVSVRTVEHHVGRICSKLGVHNRTAAVATAVALGLIES